MDFGNEQRVGADAAPCLHEFADLSFGQPRKSNLLECPLAYERCECLLERVCSTNLDLSVCAYDQDLATADVLANKLQ